MGCRVEAVSSGAKGLESLRNAYRAGDPYHVVLLDMQMPGMDGEQTTRAIMSDPVSTASGGRANGTARVASFGRVQIFGRTYELTTAGKVVLGTVALGLVVAREATTRVLKVTGQVVVGATIADAINGYIITDVVNRLTDNAASHLIEHALSPLVTITRTETTSLLAAAIGEQPGVLAELGSDNPAPQSVGGIGSIGADP